MRREIRDFRIPVVLTALDVNDMLKAGCKINYTTFRNGNHRYTWQYAYSIEGVRDWLFSQKKT